MLEGYPYLRSLGNPTPDDFLSCAYLSLTMFQSRHVLYFLKAGQSIAVAAGNAISPLLGPLNLLQLNVRHGHFVDWKMIRDAKRRECVRQFNVSRQRYNAIRKNTILPKELQEIADKEVAALPRDSNYIRLRSRCILTSRPRGVLQRWRLSRIMWRHLADYNQMSGVTRACW